MKTLCLVTPALAAANNGNWQTARRWARMLGSDYRVRLCAAWDGRPADAMLALHARRSAASIQAFATAHPDRPLVLALTGTDLYRDIRLDGPDGDAARRSMDLAWRLVVLHERAPDDLPPVHRAKTVVCFQSTAAPPARADGGPPARREMAADAVGRRGRPARPPGHPHRSHRCRAGPGAGRRGRGLRRGPPELPLARWPTARRDPRRIQAAHVLVHASRMEGGAHVVIEALSQRHAGAGLPHRWQRGPARCRLRRPV
jgi:hypothetical protein